jgi:uncharacterized protein DUF3592
MAIKLDPNSKFVRFGVPILVALFGLGFACLGGGRIYLNSIYLESGKRAAATVTYATTRNAPNSQKSFVEYKFKTPDGHEFSGSQSGYYMTVDETVTIEYLPNSPQWNRVSGSDRIQEDWNIPMAMVGFIFFLGGIYALAKGLRK